VKILSTVLVRTPDGRGFRGATVRFQRFKYDKKTGQTQPLDNKLATIDFTYNNDIKFDDQDRVINPLGFQVSSYRVDNDAASLPVAETPVPAGGAAAAPAQSANPPFESMPANGQPAPTQSPAVEQNGATSQ
jgi:type IV secretion system protein VirB8